MQCTLIRVKNQLTSVLYTLVRRMPGGWYYILEHNPIYAGEMLIG